MTTDEPPSKPDRPRRARRPLGLRRGLFFSALALVGVLGLLELGLRVAGVAGAPDRTTTWFADHILRPPLWTERALEGLGTSTMAAGQQHHFRPFTPEKPSDAYRIVVFGGSAAHGYGVLEPGSFPHRLQQLLQRAVPDREIQVINMGTIAWSSQQLLWAARRIFEVPDWDLVVVYSGHNELLELSSWKTFKEPNEHRRYTRTLLLNQRLEGLRLYQVLRSVLGRSEPPPLPADAEGRPASPEESQELGLAPGLDPISATPAMRLDDLAAIPREKRARIGDLERRYAASTYRHNVGKIVQLAWSHGVPSFLINPAPNDFHDPAWFPRDGQHGARFNALMDEAEGLPLEDSQGRMELAREALGLFDDPRAHHLLGQTLMSQGDTTGAREHLLSARQLAEYPNRVVPEVSEAILSFDGEPGVVGVLDAEALFRSQSQDGTIGYELVYDHCHPSVEGNWLIAGELARGLLGSPDASLTSLGDSPAIDEELLDSWTETGRRQAREARSEDWRLWEWTGLRYQDEQTEYIADAQGQWQERSEAAEAKVHSAEVSAQDWLVLGNYRFYDYRVEEALEAWRQALSLDQTLCLARANAAYALRMVGARDKALLEAEAAVSCEPGREDFEAERDLLRRLTAAD